jgi:hypothetical protein
MSMKLTILALVAATAGVVVRTRGQESTPAPVPLPVPSPPPTAPVTPPPAAVPDAAAATAQALPTSPARLFAALAKDRRPQWRPFFRQTVPRAGTDRFKTALALGAVCADCFLAAEARDAQQILNLLTDMAALEMSLSISRQAGGTRMKFVDLAEEGDWAGVRVQVAALMDLHRESLAAQQDDLLVELERTGLWLRAFHIGARFSSRQTKLPEQPCIWSPAMLQDLQQRTAKATEGHAAPTLQMLNTGLATLQKIWAGHAPGVPSADHLAATIKALNALMPELIGDEAPVDPPGGP